MFKETLSQQISEMSSSSLDLDDSNFTDFDLKNYEKAEERLLKPEQTAFYIFPDGRVTTPFHVSITRLMEVFDFHLLLLYGEKKIIETYTSNKDRSAAFLSYDIRPVCITLKEVVSGEVIGFTGDAFFVDPVIELISNDSVYEAVDIRQLIQLYPHNSFPDAAVNLVNEIASRYTRISRCVV